MLYAVHVKPKRPRWNLGSAQTFCVSSFHSTLSGLHSRAVHRSLWLRYARVSGQALPSGRSDVPEQTDWRRVRCWALSRRRSGTPPKTLATAPSSHERITQQQCRGVLRPRERGSFAQHSHAERGTQRAFQAVTAFHDVFVVLSLTRRYWRAVSPQTRSRGGQSILLGCPLAHYAPLSAPLVRSPSPRPQYAQLPRR